MTDSGALEQVRERYRAEAAELAHQLQRAVGVRGSQSVHAQDVRKNSMTMTGLIWTSAARSQKYSLKMDWLGKRIGT